MTKKNAQEDVDKSESGTRPKKDFAEELTEAVKDLVYISETDAGYETVFWRQEAGAAPFSVVDATVVLRCAGKDAQTPIREQTLDDFFSFPTTEQDWQTDEDKAMVRRYQNLKKLLEENLRDPKVFKIGAVEIDVYIIGIHQTGDLAGVKTSGVET